MHRPNPPDQNKRIDDSKTTEAAIAFTTRTDGTRHRFRFLHLEDQAGLWRLHEVKENRSWRIVGCEPVQHVRIGRAEFQIDRRGAPLVE